MARHGGGAIAADTTAGGTGSSTPSASAGASNGGAPFTSGDAATPAAPAASACCEGTGPVDAAGGVAGSVKGVAAEAEDVLHLGASTNLSMAGEGKSSRGGTATDAGGQTARSSGAISLNGSGTPASPPAAAGAAKGLSPLQRLGLTLVMPLLMLWCVAAFGIAWMLTFTIVPSYVLAQRLYWACPFIPHIWRRLGPVAGTAARLGFEASHCINVLTRLLTLPLRPHLPSFYILGFPKCGTTSLAEHLKSHPGLSATAGLPYHEALSKESHYFQGAYGRDCASSAALYRGCFPTVVTRWWHEVVLRAPAWVCFDACPVNACTPHAAERIRAITPHAKIIVMMRDPVPGVFSAEIMMRDMGVPLEWTLTEAVADNDPRFAGIPKDVAALWAQLASLPADAPLPEPLPEALYHSLGATLQCGMYAELLEPYLARFPRDSFMFVNFNDFVSNTEGTVRKVLDFVGLDSRSYVHKPLPPAMKNNYGSRKMHPTVKAALTRLYAEPNRRLAALIGRPDLGWSGMGADAV
ncbi:hypothetical protein GPECTOR_4g582 [Gonium pectorale]|uniref:Sulfotransferase n=1 Tax=Gonium pectorale TaxID=33097 RepID=A0A150GXA6_GONPE|nr:hypothetical protein GPECTOR_4g582 [Gonium pectorale]|eukprot:KXZ54517.1 hypothetical protein GPECTOR_4g582 [Gonium pectorale]